MAEKEPAAATENCAAVDGGCALHLISSTAARDRFLHFIDDSEDVGVGEEDQNRLLLGLEAEEKQWKIGGGDQDHQQGSARDGHIGNGGDLLAVGF